jgi:glycosyltransferase involved in cell wall biosynthesis
VRNGPDPTVMRPRDARPELRRGRAHLCTYVGVMGSQDGVEFLVAAIDDYVRTLGRDDCTFALLGDGECLPEIRREVERRGLSDYVDLPGWQDDDGLFAYLSTSDLGLCPEPPTPLNQMSTMVKTAEYMAFELPVVALDLQETRVTAGSCGRYATTTDPLAYARLVAELLDDPMTRRELGTAARRRVLDTLAWSHQQTAYVDVYRSLLSGD